MILKANPLKNCKFGAGWNNSGRVADTLTIIARQKTKATSDAKIQGLETEESKNEKKNTNEITKSALSKIGKEEPKPANDANKNAKNPVIIGKRGTNTTNKYLNGLDEKNAAPPEAENKFQLDFNIDAIKLKYLYPFNENKLKKIYQNLADDPTTSYLPKIDKGVNNDVLNSLKYYFPFSHIKVPSMVLKELQTPLKVTTGEIGIELKNYVEKFPFSVFPQQKVKVDNDVSNSTFQQTPHDSRVTDKLPAPIQGRAGNLLKTSDIEKCKQVLLTEEMARIIGVVTHFSYWQIFGHLNPVQPDLITKKQMILISIEQINVLRKKVKNVKLWSLFVFPMMILTIRMMSEFILRNNYNEFYEMEKPCCIALEKLNLLINNMFDPNMLYSRFAFFESEIEAVNKKFSDHLDETKLRSKRIYGTNPYIDLYFPSPESDFVRNIRQRKINAKNTKIEKEVKEVESEAEEEIGTTEETDKAGDSNNKAYLTQSYKVKMFQVIFRFMNMELRISNRCCWIKLMMILEVNSKEEQIFLISQKKKYNYVNFFNFYFFFFIVIFL